MAYHEEDHQEFASDIKTIINTLGISHMFYQFQQFTTLAIHSFKTTIIWAHVHSHSEGKACFLFLFNHLGGIVARLSDFTHQKQVETNKSNNSCLVLINGFPQLLVLNTPPPPKKKNEPSGSASLSLAHLNSREVLLVHWSTVLES